ncbi:MAG: AAA family ATPase, partial [Gemmatimonadota bacterium]
MSEPRLEAIELEYGCHSGRFDLPDGQRPVVIAGRNGSGKTTLLEAFLRTLYGFSRRKPEERRLLELRQPWSGRPTEAQVWLRATDGSRFTVHRDFASDRVVACDDSTGLEVFRGDANPVGVRSESRRYQDLVREWIGFGTLEPYRGTAWIAQGELVDTKLDDELLRAAAGTHRKVETALKELREAFEALTREPIEPGGRAKRLARELEELQEAVSRGVERLEAARDARGRKRPVIQRTAEIQSSLDEVQAEIRLLEAAYRPITERRTLLAEQKEAEAHLAALTEAMRWLEAAAGELGRAEADQVSAEAGGRYPDDFEARLGQAELLWDRVAALEEQLAGEAAYESGSPSPWRSTIGVAGIALTILGGAVGLA